MKAEELMVGDWVRNIYGVKGWVFDIRYYKDGFGERYAIKLAYDDKGESYACPEMDLIEPIPLTPEILEKNGFTKGKGGNFVYDNEDENIFMIFYPKKMNYNGIYDFIDISIGCIDIKELPIQYVHELQHALRLCGIEKEIGL